MILAELKWTADNSAGYDIDRYRSQFLMPVHGTDYAHGAYQIIKRVPPHTRAGYYSIRGFDRPYGKEETSRYFNSQYARNEVKLLDELEIACFIAHLREVPTPKPRWWLRMLKWFRTKG